MAGNVTYFEVPSSDIEATQRFWGSLFGWRFYEGNFPGYSMIGGPTPMGGAPHEDSSRHPRHATRADPTTKVGLVEPVRVEDEFQRRGLASAMLTAGIDRLVARGAERVKISYGSEAAAGTYQGVGFQPTSAATWYRQSAG